MDKNKIFSTENGFVIKDANEEVVKAFDREALLLELASRRDIRDILDGIIKNK